MITFLEVWYNLIIPIENALKITLIIRWTINYEQSFGFIKD